VTGETGTKTHTHSRIRGNENFKKLLLRAKNFLWNSSTGQEELE